MNERFSNFFKYALLVFSEYKKITNPESNLGQIKIVDSHICENTDQTLFTIQLFGKNVFPILSAKELAEDEDILMRFSKADLKKIVESAKNDETKLSKLNEKTIDAVIFDPSTKKRFYSFAIKKGNIVETKRFSAQEIYSNKEFLLNMDKYSIADVSYEAGKENQSGS
ncbi:MAG: hypothetical protein SFW07_06500 [Gammaproteobacteria bacterium]|nr:hypothetical protein [Gammaproteobacteria bacterium]